jgi:RNA polymerase sigma factor (sigma-70 family)
MSSPSRHPPILNALLRELAPQVLGAVARKYRDFAAAEDAVQEAMLAAALQWPATGIPENPRAWMIGVASRRMVDHIRSESARRTREAASPVPVAPVDHVDPEEDDTLVLLFMSCHPALTDASAIALTLRAVGGLTTAEIARAFLVPESTMAQRISRAKQTIQTSGVPFALPEAAERASRLRTVLHVLYLIFNEGYTSSGGEHFERAELSSEAIRLVRLLRRTLPYDGEVGGLLALMLLTDARRRARSGPAGEMIPLTKQDRRLWDRSQIQEGIALVTEALSKRSIGEYQIQAAIAAVHDEAPNPDATDWPQILALYEVLLRIADNPMVVLNHAVAVAMVHGPAAGLERLRVLDADRRIAEHHRLDAVRAHLLEMAGNVVSAIRHYRIAAGRTASIPERNYLLEQASRLEERES